MAAAARGRLPAQAVQTDGAFARPRPRWRYAHRAPALLRGADPAGCAGAHRRAAGGRSAAPAPDSKAARTARTAVDGEPALEADRQRAVEAPARVDEMGGRPA